MVYSWADNLGLFQRGVFPTSSNLKLNKRADYVSRWMPPMEISVPGSVFQCFLSVRQKANILQKGSFLERSQFFHPDVLRLTCCDPTSGFNTTVRVTAMRLHKNSEQVVKNVSVTRQKASEALEQNQDTQQIKQSCAPSRGKYNAGEPGTVKTTTRVRTGRKEKRWKNERGTVTQRWSQINNNKAENKVKIGQNGSGELTQEKKRAVTQRGTNRETGSKML